MCINTESPCILVVDDKPNNLEIIRKMLEVCGGYQTDGAETGGEVIRLLDGRCGQGQPCYDLILLDIDLPDVRGGTLATWIRAAYPRVPIVLLTAYGRLPAFTDISEALAIPFLQKPVDAEVLCETVRREIADYKALRGVGKPVVIPPVMLDHIREVERLREAARRTHNA
jgi:CheY-like chemotaxis protein